MKERRSGSTREPNPPLAEPADTGSRPATDSVPRDGESPAVGGQHLPIVGLGASAGGLEALELFLQNVPAESGMAFVIVQHLDPTRKGIMAELLQRKTSMRVAQVEDRMRVEPDTVYVIPPNRDLSILHGALHLLEPVEPRGMRLPIDFFLRTLAADQRERSIGVILSGMGSDGTLGLRAIKEMAGVALVQDPDTAGFDSMPRSAIGAGLADIVAAPQELPGRILDYLRHAPIDVAREGGLEQVEHGDLDKILVLLRAHTSHDFSHYKKSTLYRRIDRRMRLHQLKRIADYVRFLRANPSEADLLFRELLISVTSFFRDPGVWEQLRDRFLPELLASLPSGGTVRAWVPGCSTGEEAYSLAMALEEAGARLEPPKGLSLQIFATDLDHAAIERARSGLYPPNVAADLGPQRLQRFFVEEESGYRIRKEIRKSVILAPHNLVMDPPFTKLDLLSCRNLLIYLTAEIQKKLLPVFHYSLNPGGLLLLGSAETAGGARSLFHPLDAKARIYRRNTTPAGAGDVEFPAAFARRFPRGASAADPPLNSPSTQALVEGLILERFSPPSVLVTQQGDILYISGKTGRFLEPAAGQANWNIFSMAREGLALPLETAFHQAVLRGEPVHMDRIAVDTDNWRQALEITVLPLDEPAPLRGRLLVVFHPVAQPESEPAATAATGAAGARGRKRSRTSAVERRLRESEDELRVTREEMQASQEELRSANEELQSANEELQSTNEELTSSKEEMQSMNEELQTVNQELQAKLEELSLASDDMKNLLESTSIATLFLDDELNVRRYTSETNKIIKLIPGDVGRPITDLASDLEYPDLGDDAREVLRTLVYREKDIPTRDGRWYRTRVMPYRTRSNRIEGVVITFADVTVAKQLEASLRDSQQGPKQEGQRGPGERSG
ncbi:MAG TPA: chemotaxis protein CheB [Thermoanaerobaculia bacterium]|nr:chemotaxis protein CheB [Thermoanaerobaculia bacterium]